MSLIFYALQRMESDRDAILSFPPSEADEFLHHARLEAGSKEDSVLTEPDDEANQSRAESAPPLYTVEWPQPASNSTMAGLSSPLSDPPEHPTDFAGAAVAGSAEPRLELSPSIQGALPALPAAPPDAEAILPVLEEGISTDAPTKLTTPQIDASPAAPLLPVPQTAELVHMKSTLAELNTDYRELRDQFVTQNSSLKRLGHHLEKVREATDRNTHELREWIEELRGVNTKITFVAMVAFGLLGASVIIDIIVYFHVF
ncbi:MAG TPA: hypothetical protein VMW15_06445 [Terracidiphilus sp.]|nr:hypothetical protein [Terracidiphilus sp.]